MKVNLVLHELMNQMLTITSNQYYWFVLILLFLFKLTNYKLVWPVLIYKPKLLNFILKRIHFFNIFMLNNWYFLRQKCVPGRSRLEVKLHSSEAESEPTASSDDLVQTSCRSSELKPDLQPQHQSSSLNSLFESLFCKNTKNKNKKVSNIF